MKETRSVVGSAKRIVPSTRALTKNFEVFLFEGRVLGGEGKWGVWTKKRERRKGGGGGLKRMKLRSLIGLCLQLWAWERRTRKDERKRLDDFSSWSFSLFCLRAYTYTKLRMMMTMIEWVPEQKEEKGKEKEKSGRWSLHPPESGVRWCRLGYCIVFILSM